MCVNSRGGAGCDKSGSVAKIARKTTIHGVNKARRNRIKPGIFTIIGSIFVGAAALSLWLILGGTETGIYPVDKADLTAMRDCGDMEVESQKVSECLVGVAVKIGERDGGDWRRWQQALDTLDDYVVEAELKNGHHVTHNFFVASKLEYETMRKLDFDRRDIGFVHGWTEWFLGKRENYNKGGEVYDMLCRPEKNRDLGEDCAHGYGHVAFQQELGEFSDRIDYCNGIAKFVIDVEAEVGQCYAGLLMSHGPSGATDEETGNPREGDPLRRPTREEAEDLCRGASPEAAERCWPWVVWFYYDDPDALESYFETCDTSGAGRWCGQGIARYLFFILREREETLYTDVLNTCLEQASEHSGRRESKLGCAIEVVRIDIEDWWRDGNRTYREFPCSTVNDPEGVCKEAVSIVFSTPCEVDQDVEWMDVCIRNREAKT